MPRALIRLVALFIAALAAGPVAAAFETRAGAAWVYDVGTGTVLLEKDANRPLPPASMSKLMTLYMLFEALKDGRVTMETTFAVSARAKAMRGSTMFLNTQDRPTVRDLIIGIIVNSGNDACVVVAEGLAGTEEAFARLMTDRARALGMEHTTLANASGWPDPNHRMSMRDLGLLTVRLIEDFPEHYGFFDLREFDYKNRSPANRMNRNPLFRLFPAEPGNADAIRADGLKTGHTSEAGYGIVGSAVMGERRVVVVVSGLESEQARADETARILNWAFRQFQSVDVARTGEPLGAAEVWLGAAPPGGLVAGADARLLIPASAREGITREVVLRAPVPAPIRAGDPLGEMIVRVPDMPERRVPVLAAGDVAGAGFAGRLGVAAEVLLGRARSLAGF
ncbi:MAG: D-alanyl-D-alanine carboxypeptidase family protein [Gemmobacter sp.]